MLIPASRVQRALASFPTYADQEVIAANDGEDDSSSDLNVPLTAGFTVDPSADDPLPRRPTALGRNRLPAFALPGQERVVAHVEALGFTARAIDIKLSPTLLAPSLGFHGAEPRDPLGLFAGNDTRGAALSARGRDAAIDKQLGFLETHPAETLHTVSLQNGIWIPARRDRGAPRTAITVRLFSSADGPTASRDPGESSHRGADVASAEALYTTTVDNRDAEAGVELAAARLRLLLGGSQNAELAEIRAHAAAARRKLLVSAPYGTSWIALSDALFPPGHPLAGTLLGASRDTGAFCELRMADALQRERVRATASVTVVGDVEEQRIQKIAEAFLASTVLPRDEPVGPHPRDERLVVEEAVPAPRLLVGWIGPGEGEVGDAPLQVAVEILENPKLRRLSAALVDAGVASNAHAFLEVGPRASAAVVEIDPFHVPQASRRLEATRRGAWGPGGQRGLR